MTYSRPMGRKRQWSEDMVARFPEGTFSRMAAASRPGEGRTDFVRAAVERELRTRGGHNSAPTISPPGIQAAVAEAFGLKLPDSLPFERWKDIGEKLHAASKAIEAAEEACKAAWRSFG